MDNLIKSERHINANWFLLGIPFKHINRNSENYGAGNEMKIGTG